MAKAQKKQFGLKKTKKTEEKEKKFINKADNSENDDIVEEIMNQKPPAVSKKIVNVHFDWKLYQKLTILLKKTNKNSMQEVIRDFLEERVDEKLKELGVDFKKLEEKSI